MQLHAGKLTPTDYNESFSEAVESHLSDLNRYCTSLTQSKWSGEDLAQETLTKAYENWLKNPRPISKAYLCRIASNHWIDEYRRRKLDLDYKGDLSRIAQEKGVAKYEVEAAIEILLNHLSLKQRIVFLLVDGFRYTTQEASTMLGMTEGAVKAVLHRARKKLDDVKEDEALHDCDNDEVNTYVNAFSSGLPHLVVNLFRNRTNEPKMILNQTNLGSGQLFVTEVKGSHSSYLMVTVPTKSGVMLVPVFQKEIAVLLEWTEELIKHSQRSQLLAA